MRRPTHRRISLFTALVAVCLSSPPSLLSAEADALSDGQEAFSCSDYPKAYRLLAPEAERGSREAQAKVGFMFFYGLGVDKDFAQAFRWTLPAAEAGNTTAQHLLSKMFRNGWGTRADASASYSWCRRAAEQGLPDAMACMGEHNAEGIGVPRNPNLAADWLFKAGMAFHRQGRRDMALAMVERIRELVSPDHFLAYRLLDEIYGEEGGGDAEVNTGPR